MAHLFKKTITRYVDADGNRVTKGAPGAHKARERSRDWYCRFSDQDGIRREKRLCGNKTAAQQMLNELVRQSEFGKAGLIDPFTEHVKRPLSEHVADFRRHLESKGNGATHVETTVARVEAIIAGCNFKFIADISASSVAGWLADRRAADGTTDANGRVARFGIASSNHYLTAMKAFSRWLVTDRRTADNRLAHLSRINADTDVRRERRHLSQEEFGKLLSTTETNGERCGLSAKSRAMLYLTAAYTGLRASELASLTQGSIDFSAGTVTVEAGYSKHRRRDVLPLHADLAANLQDWLAHRSNAESDTRAVLPLKGRHEAADAPLWPGPWAENRHGAEMLRHDLDATGIPYRNGDGRVFDFHSLRHQFISMLAAAGVHPKTAQELARHSDINLTMQRYTHVRLNDLTAAVSSLPAPARAPKVCAATGTEDAGSVVAPMVALKADKAGNSVRPIETTEGGDTERPRTSEAQQETPAVTGVESDCDRMKAECRRRDSNPHSLWGNWILNPARLPIPPLRQACFIGFLRLTLAPAASR